MRVETESETTIVNEEHNPETIRDIIQTDRERFDSLYSVPVLLDARS